MFAIPPASHIERKYPSCSQKLDTSTQFCICIYKMSLKAVHFVCWQNSKSCNLVFALLGQDDGQTDTAATAT